MITLELSWSAPSPDWERTDASPGVPWTEARCGVAAEYEPLRHGSPLLWLSAHALSTFTPTISPLNMTAKNNGLKSGVLIMTAP